MFLPTQINCDYECAQTLPSFFPVCKHLVEVMMVSMEVSLDKLTRTCLKLPQKSMVYAIAGVTNCNASSCTDGIKSGDEAGVDCSGSCPTCKTRLDMLNEATTLLTAPNLSPRCSLYSLNRRVQRVNAACTASGTSCALRPESHNISLLSCVVHPAEYIL